MYVPKQTKEEVIKRLKELNKMLAMPTNKELDLLKQTFYKLHKAEQETARKTFIGPVEREAFCTPGDDSESRFKGSREFHQRKEAPCFAGAGERKRRELAEETGHHWKAGKSCLNLTMTPNKIQWIQKLQQEWNEIKQVPAAKINELWKNYQLLCWKVLIWLSWTMNSANMISRKKLNCISVEQAENWQTEKTSFPLSTITETASGIPWYKGPVAKNCAKKSGHVLKLLQQP